MEVRPPELQEVFLSFYERDGDIEREREKA
jgi:hypothetical protein